MPELASPYHNWRIEHTTNNFSYEYDHHIKFNEKASENRLIRNSDDESVEGFKAFPVNNLPDRGLTRNTSNGSSYPKKRRKTAYRDWREVGDEPLDPADIEQEKQFIKSQYSFAPECELFDIVYVQSEKYNK